MREVRSVLVLFLGSLIHAGVAHAQWIQTNSLYGGTIIGFAVSGANLFAATGGSEDHLTTNEEYRSKVESAFKERQQLAHNRKDRLFNVFRSGLSLQQEEALKFLFAYMPLNDLADYDGDFVLANANIALRTRQESPWGKSIPEDIFLHYVLPFRISYDDNPDSFRITYYDEIQGRVKGMDATEAALEINHWCHEKVTYGTIVRGTNLGPVSTILSAQGACAAESIFTVASLRTAGIPARVVWAPFAHIDAEHAWVEVWIDGKWHYMGACEPKPILDWAWFTEDARRAMWIETESFGAKYGQENTTVCYRNYSFVNTLSRYAVTKTIKVKVLDTNNVPVKNALVECLLYGDAEFLQLAEVPTDEFGVSQFETGLGDLLIWARKGDDFNFKKVSVSDIDTLNLILNLKPADNGFQELDLGVPIARAPLKGPATELIAANTKRLNKEDVIRQVYIDSWMKPEEAANLAKELGADPEIIKDIISRSLGNYKDIASFLTHTSASDRPLAINLLKQVSDDLSDTEDEIFADHLNNVIRFENTHGAYDYELYSKYVLNPRIVNRMIAAWRKYLFESMPVGFRQAAINDPSVLIKYVNNNIVIDDSEDYFYGGLWKQSISPKGVDELKVSNSFSRDIYFVALCRSLGIPSRLDPRPGSNVPQFYFKNEWHDVWFAGKNQPPPGKGFIRFTSAEKNPVPEYGTHFTMAYFENGHYKTLYNIKVTDFKDELALAPGHYMLVTGNRINDSKILSTLAFFELKENERKAIDIELRRWTRNTTGVELYFAALSGDITNGKRLIQEGADVDRKDEWGWTALYWAMRGKQKEAAEFLIAKGANVNAKGEKGLTPLHLAITNNQDELVEMLIAKGADVNAKGERDQTPLHLAIGQNQKQLAETLIAKGADVNAKDNWNWTPLHGAIYSSKDTTLIKAMVELLITRGANANARDGDNRTPLWYAQKEGYTEIVELLRKHGVEEKLPQTESMRK